MSEERPRPDLPPSPTGVAASALPATLEAPPQPSEPPPSLVRNNASSRYAKEVIDLRRFEWPEPLLRDLVRVVGVRSGGRWADLGCGWGFWSLSLARAAALRVDAFDADPVAVDECNRIAGAPARSPSSSRAPGARSGRVRAQVGDALDPDLLPEAHYDGVTAHMLLRHLPRPEEFLQIALRALRPGGLLLLVDRDDEARWSTLHLDLPGRSTGDFLRGLGKPDPEHLERAVSGMRELGYGDRSILRRLPDLLLDAGFTDVTRIPNPVRWTLTPPYDPFQRTLARELSRHWQGGEDEALRSGALHAGLDPTQADELVQQEARRRGVPAGRLERGGLELGLDTGLVAVVGRAS